MLLAALQWALFLPLRVMLILLGVLVVPLALPLIKVQGPVVPYSINKVIQDGQQIINQATTDAASARHAAGSLQRTVDDLAGRLATQGRSHSCTAAASQAAPRAVLVLADLFKRADERAGNLAAEADQSRGRADTCERAYEGLGK